ncbi:MAG: hypothetical protein JXB03_03290 [Spirochaetales bacterium]|nr:hypothetical protein [Spirochaetales bacterium]
MKRPVMFLCLLCGFLMPLFSQSITQMEFRDQPITQILAILGETAGVSIIPDETVSGTASYYFARTGFEEALELFLSAYRLHYTKETKQDRTLYYVSRILTSYDSQQNLVSIRADEVELSLVLRTLSRAMGKTVLFDPLPSDRITLNSVGISPEKALSMAVARYPDYELVADSDYYYIKRKPRKDEPASTGASGSAITREGESFSVSAESARFFDLVKELFSKGDKEYALMLNNDTMLKNLSYSLKTFEEMLRIILEQANADYTVYNDIYYVFQINNRDILNNYKTVEIVPLKYITTQELPQLLPSSLNSSGIMKLNDAENLVILNGSIAELKAIKDFLPLVDKPMGGMEYFRYTFQRIGAEKVQSLLPQKYQRLSPVIHQESNSVIFRIPGGTKEDLSTYLDILDASPGSTPVTLKYLKSEDLMKNLPPSIGKDHIAVTANPSLILFTGPEEKKKQFMRELALFDTPVPQIRYDLLIVQYQESSALNYDMGLSNSRQTGAEGEATENTFIGAIGSLLDLNFDIVSNFGYNFALSLSADLEDRLATVMADTTLNGLSGEEVKFQNTDTYRYVEEEVDEQGNKVAGVTRELSSGLFLNIKGWVSGDGMITMDISSTVSKESSESGDSSSLPPTSERVINTHVRTRSGEPVIIGGLIQQETKITEKKTPILGFIPFVGKLLTKEIKSTENTELSIYIVPTVEYSMPKEENYGAEIRHLYERFIKGSQK